MFHEHYTIATYEVPRNLVILSGVHGCGKNTLMDDYLNANINNEFQVLRYHKCKMTAFDNIFERQTRRIAKYAIDWHRIMKMATDNPDKMILTDRCFWDAFAYLHSFRVLGWITTEEYEWLMRMLETAFLPYRHTQIKPFFLLPPFELIQSNLHTRQQKFVKWNEKDLQYCQTTYNQYEKIIEEYFPEIS